MIKTIWSANSAIMSLLRRTLLLQIGSFIVLFGSCNSRPAAKISVTLSPASATVATSAVQAFTATVSGTANTAVAWKVNGVAGGNSNAGLISTTELDTHNEALYLGPASVPAGKTVTITAVSLASPGASASATVTIESPSRSGVTYYVSTKGRDANPGTRRAPWRTIQHAADKVKPGDTVEVEGGVYHEVVTMKSSGNASSGYITFTNYPGQTPVLDGTGLPVPKGRGEGLFNLIGNFSYLVIRGFEIRNFSSSTAHEVPIGINFKGAGSHIEILHNHIHNIVQTLKTCHASNALGVAIYGTEAPTAISDVTFLGNELDHNITGCSENVSFDGNVRHFVEAHNRVHDGDNIGLDDIGFERVAPDPAYDRARDGWVFQNTIYNISSTRNPVYNYQASADGYYCDGCSRVIVERNLIYNVDINEMASEHFGRTSSYVLFRNNVIYNSLFDGLSIGGYAKKEGGTDHCIIVNNSLFNNGNTRKFGKGEFQIQWHATNNTVENNIMDNSSLNFYLVYDYTSSVPHPALLDHNDYFSASGASGSRWEWQGKPMQGFSNYQAASGQDAHSLFADPRYDKTSAEPFNFDIPANSPAANAGVNLGVNVVGVRDFAGNPRVNAKGQISMGAFQQ